MGILPPLPTRRPLFDRGITLFPEGGGFACDAPPCHGGELNMKERGSTSRSIKIVWLQVIPRYHHTLSGRTRAASNPSGANDHCDAFHIMRSNEFYISLIWDTIRSVSFLSSRGWDLFFGCPLPSGADLPEKRIPPARPMEEQITFPPNLHG